jgi:polysaccharide export outer membrane protein
MRIHSFRNAAKPRHRRLYVLIAALVLAGELSGDESSDRRIGPHDEIEVRVEELPEIDRGYVVAEDGTVELPHVGEVRAEGRTERELAGEIRLLLEGTGLRRATVSVRITRFSRPVAVLGAVVNPGNRVITGRATLLDVLLEAGGLTDDRGDSVLVRRRSSNGLTGEVEISVEDLFERGDPAVNIPILAGDVIRVPKAPAIEVSFLGEVVETGTVTFRGRERVTLLVAIARAGGITDEASAKIRILRGRGDERVEITVNYRRILAGKDPDPELEDGDILVVRESFF